MDRGSRFALNPKKLKRCFEKPIKNPWQRKEKHLPHSSKMLLNTFEECFDTLVERNFGLDVDTKRAALKISQSVVSIITFKGDELLFKGSGTIVSTSEEDASTYTSTIVTSATVILDSGSLPNNLRVEVCLYDGKVYDGEVFAFDLHFNIASIKIKSAASLSTATMVKLDDTLSLDPSLIEKFHHREPSNSFQISPGDTLIAMGRFHEYPYKLMGASGEFSLASCNFDCPELLRASCKISKSGTGGPLINLHGHVIGVNFFEELYTPFLPINIVLKCLEQFERYGRVHQPFTGIVMINLYAASLDKLDRIVIKFPGTFTGVLVEEVVPGSPAADSGIRPGDVIARCNGKFVQNFLELFEMILDNVGGFLEVTVLREETGEEVNLSIHVSEVAPDAYHSWPVPEKRWTIADIR